MIVVELAEVAGLPVVNGAALVKREGASGWYSVHFAPVNKLWVMLFRVGRGKYLAVPSSPEAAAEMPEVPSVRWSAYRRRPAVRRKWRHWVARGTEDGKPFTRRRLRTDKESTISDIPDDESGGRAFPRTVGATEVEWATMTLPSVCGQRKNFLADEVEDTEPRPAQPPRKRKNR